MISIMVLFLGAVYCASMDTEEPGINIIARSSVFDVGKKFAIYCGGSGVPGPLMWYTPTGDVVENRSGANRRLYVERRDTEPNLISLVNHFTLIEDNGNWTCKAGDHSGTINIVVGEKAIIDNNYEEVFGESGKSLKLHCEVKGYPEPTVQWFRGTAPVYVDENRHVQKQFDDYILILRRLSYSDSGDYVCKAMQKSLSYITYKHVKLEVRHKKSGTYHNVVIEALNIPLSTDKPILFDNDTKEILSIPPHVSYHVEDVYIAYNHSKSLKCSALANPHPKFAWYKRNDTFDMPIQDEKSISISDDLMSSSLSVYVTVDDDPNQYKCLAINDKGSVFTVFNVIPAAPPLVPDNITQVRSNMSAITFSVKCPYCNFVREEGKRPDPRNLPITAYLFQLRPCSGKYCKETHVDESDKNYLEFVVGINSPNANLFDINPLPTTTTTFRVRVRSISAAGFSGWLYMAEPASTKEIPAVSHAHINRNNVSLHTCILFVLLNLYNMYSFDSS